MWKTPSQNFCNVHIVSRCKSCNLDRRQALASALHRLDPSAEIRLVDLMEPPYADLSSGLVSKIMQALWTQSRWVPNLLREFRITRETQTKLLIFGWKKCGLLRIGHWFISTRIGAPGHHAFWRVRVYCTSMFSALSSFEHYFHQILQEVPATCWWPNSLWWFGWPLCGLSLRPCEQRRWLFHRRKCPAASHYTELPAELSAAGVWILDSHCLRSWKLTCWSLSKCSNSYWLKFARFVATICPDWAGHVYILLQTTLSWMYKIRLLVIVSAVRVLFKSNTFDSYRIWHVRWS